LWLMTTLTLSLTLRPSRGWLKKFLGFLGFNVRTYGTHSGWRYHRQKNTIKKKLQESYIHED